MSDRYSQNYYSSYQAPRRRSRRKRSRAPMVLLVLFIIVIICAVLATVLNPEVAKEATLEAGGTVTMSLFMKRNPENGSFTTDVSAIDTSVPGFYAVGIKCGGKEYDCSLIIRDTVPPSGVSIPMTVKKGVVPDPASCVADIRDVTAVTVRFKTEPDVSTGGEHKETLVLTDSSGNETELPVTITVLEDSEPPVISGTHDLEAFLGDPVSYRENVTVTDDEDPNPSLEIDNSAVDMTKAGVYDVIYRATDAAGNVTEVTVKLTLTEKPSNYVEPEVVLAEARKVLEQITTGSMDDMDVAYAIYRWAKYNIVYVNTSDKSSWTGAAYQAFTKRSGDCYVYFAACKALLTAAGIENADIVKSDTSHSQHFWNLINLGDGWYHLDATPRKGDGDNFFMVTDAELEAYSVAHNNSHIFDPSLYPERATKSVQSVVNYNASTLRR